MKLFSVAEMVAAERAAAESGHSYETMMEEAGRGVAEAVLARLETADRNVLVLVGPGNNGGDGLVAGRYLAEAGANVAVYMFKPRDARSDENFARIQEMGLMAVTAEFDQRYRVLRTRLNITDIVIDALLGTGVTRPIEGELAALLRQVHGGIEERNAILADRHASRLVAPAEIRSDSARCVQVVAVDCPSGLNCDSGALDPLAVPADLTVTFAGPKRGHFLFPGAQACGDLVVAEIGIAERHVCDVKTEVATAQSVRDMLPARPLEGHKGTFGRALIAAGSADYWGAPLLCGRGAYRVGCGLVALAVPAIVRPVAATALPEATFPSVPDEQNLGQRSADLLLENIDAFDALLVGPGLGSAAAPFLDALFSADVLPPLIVDADGLNYLAARPQWWEMLPPGTILTPHPGEMRRLIGEAPEDDRIAVATRCAAAWNAVVVLKGAHTVVAMPDGTTTINPIATPLLATAGSGDVLAGVIAGLLAQGVAPSAAAIAGVYLHAAAGNALAPRFGNAGALASDIADIIPEIRHRLII